MQSLRTVNVQLKWGYNLKKLILFVSLFGLALNAHADTISLNTISADSTVNTLNTNFTTIANVINGEIEGSGTNGSLKNIKADSLGELDFADAINPRVRDAELLGIGVDTTTEQESFVYSGCIPADDTDLTSDISACVAYVNGYRISKSATPLTYTASMDNYVDLSQSGTYTISTVSVGGSAPAVAANSARLSKVTTDGTEITAVTDLANRRLEGLVTPSNFRSGLFVSYDTSARLIVLPGTVEINNIMVNKTANTTLTLATAGDWAGGSSLQAANTYGYVGIDADGNIDMHTTAPTHFNYDVSNTVGKKRYATWAGTVYRVLGWFWMNNGSGLDTATVGNIPDGDVTNNTYTEDTAQVSTASATFTNLMQTRFYTSSGRMRITHGYRGATDIANGSSIAVISVDTVGYQASSTAVAPGGVISDGDTAFVGTEKTIVVTLGQGTHTIVQRGKYGPAASAAVHKDKIISIEEI